MSARANLNRHLVPVMFSQALRSFPSFLDVCLRVGTALVMCNAGAAYAQNPDCHSLAPRADTSVKLENGGRFCLETDLNIRDRPAFFPDGRSGLPSRAVAITADDVTFDLGGHSVRVGDVTLGLQIRRHGSNPSEPRQPQQISIRNGTIRVVSSIAIDAGFSSQSIPSDMGDPLESISKEGKSQELLDATRETLARLQTTSFQAALARRPARPADYQERNILIENLHIDARDGNISSRARAGAINIQGAGTVIRHCVIETNAGTALWIFGPNALIENNTIIVHGAAPLREADAPIRLHQADGAVIRNNKIIIKGSANRRGISVFDTGTITVDNNTFYGMTENDEIAKAFTRTLNMTQRGSRFEPGWKALIGAY